jgi:hypothetical protein
MTGKNVTLSQEEGNALMNPSLSVRLASARSRRAGRRRRRVERPE